MQATLSRTTEAHPYYSVSYAVLIKGMWYNLGTEINSNGDGESELDDVILAVAHQLTKNVKDWKETRREPADEEKGSGEIVTEEAGIEIDESTFARIVVISAGRIDVLL